MFRRQRHAFALNRAGERGRDVEIQRIAELIHSRCAAGLDAGGHIARVVTAEARFSQRSHQIAQRLEAKKIQALVGDFKLHLRLRVAHLPADTRLLRRIVRLVDADVVFLLHALDQLLDQFIQRAFHLHLLQLLRAFARPANRCSAMPARWRAQIVERLLAIAESRRRVILEPALQQEIRERAEQVFHAHFASGIGNVLAVADAFHRNGRWSLVIGRWQCNSRFLASLGMTTFCSDRRIDDDQWPTTAD